MQTPAEAEARRVARIHERNRIVARSALLDRSAKVGRMMDRDACVLGSYSPETQAAIREHEADVQAFLAHYGTDGLR